MIPNLPVVVRGYVANAVAAPVAAVAGGGSGGGGGESAGACVAGSKGGEKGWRAWREWLAGDGGIDTRYLREQFGEVCVTVHNCAKRKLGLDTCAKKEVAMAEFLDWWEGPVGSRVRGRGSRARDALAVEGCRDGDGDGRRDRAAVAGGGVGAGPEGDKDDGDDVEEEEEILYLKDWNFTKEFPGYGLYVWPPWFEEDWLNAYEERCAM